MFGAVVGSGGTIVRRREFVISLVGATAWPAMPRAQQAMPVIGYLGLLAPEADILTAFRQGLSQIGYVEGQNVTIKYRWADAQFDRLPALASELASEHVDVLAAVGTPAAAFAAEAVTTTIPIVFLTGDDPVRIGLVNSLNRPEGNATGVYMLTSSLEPKRLELIHELIPNASEIGVIVDPNSPDTSLQVKELSAAASALGR